MYELVERFRHHCHTHAFTKLRIGVCWSRTPTTGPGCNPSKWGRSPKIGADEDKHEADIFLPGTAVLLEEVPLRLDVALHLELPLGLERCPQICELNGLKPCPQIVQVLDARCGSPGDRQRVRCACWKKKAPPYGISSRVRLWWVFKEAKGPNGRVCSQLSRRGSGRALHASSSQHAEQANVA